MVIGFEHVAVAIHGPLQATAPGERLDDFGIHARFDPAGDRKVVKRMPSLVRKFRAACDQT